MSKYEALLKESTEKSGQNGKLFTLQLVEIKIRQVYNHAEIVKHIRTNGTSSELGNKHCAKQSYTDSLSSLLKNVFVCLF